MVGNARSVTSGDPAMLDAAIAGDVAAFSRIVALHHHDMLRVCQVICGDVELAEDAVQAAWPNAWRHLRSVRDPERLRAWLVTIAANEARRMLRRERRDRVVAIDVVDLEAVGGDPAEHATDADVLAAVRRLPPDDRQLLAMRYVAGFDSVEIAAALGTSASGVRTRLSRLVARLRTEVGDD